MSVWHITSPEGQILEIEGDVEPTQDEITQLFEQHTPVVRDVAPGSLTPPDLLPAIRTIGGKIETGEPGDTHPDIIKRQEIPAVDIDQRGFTGPSGEFYDRETAAKGLQVPTEFEPGRLHSTDLINAQELPRFEAPLEITDKGPVYASQLEKDKLAREWGQVKPPPIPEVSSLAPVTAGSVTAVTPEGKRLLPGTQIPQAPAIEPEEPKYLSGLPMGAAGEMTDKEVEENVKAALDQYAQQTTKITERNPILEALNFTPDKIPSGEEISRALGIPKALGIPISTADKLLSGFVGFLGSTSGASQAALAEFAVLKPILFAKWSADLTKSGGEQAAYFWEALKQGDMQAAADAGGTVVADALMLFGVKVPGRPRTQGLIERGVRSVPEAIGAVVPKAPSAIAEGESKQLPSASELFKASVSEVKELSKGVQGEALTEKLAREMTEDQLKQAEPVISAYRQKQADAKTQLEEGKIGIQDFINITMEKGTKGKIFADVFARLNRPVPEAVEIAGVAEKRAAPETKIILDALAARAQEADTPNANAVRLMLNRQFGLTPGGPVRVIHAPTSDSLGTIWWDKTGKPVGIQINAARIRGIQQLRDVLLHEVGHWADLTSPKPVIDAITKGMTLAEKQEIISDVKRLKYEHGEWKKEFRADAVRKMAAKWAERNPTWWQNIVANVSRVANEMLGIKLTRLGAENAAARSLAIALEAIKSKGKQYADALESAVRVPEQVAKDMPEIIRTRLLEQVQKELRKGGIAKMKAEEPPKPTDAAPPPKPPEEKPTTDDAIEGKPGHSIAQEGREAGASAGTRPLVEPGQGIGRDAAIIRGRALRESGYDVEAAMRKFEQTGAVDPDAVMAARAEGEARYRAANEAAKKFGEDSAEYWKAWQSLAEWDRRTKPMATALHKGFVAHQGETDIDTGTITGLRRAFKDQTARGGKEGKEFTPGQEKQASKIAKESGKANEAADQARETVLKTVRENAKTVGLSEAEKRASDAASRTVRESAIRLAEATNKRRIAQTVREQQIADLEFNAAKKALDAANKTLRSAGARTAKAENKRRIEQAARDKEIQELRQRATNRALSAVERRKIEAAIKAAESERKRLADPSIPVWEKANEYLEKGMRSFDDIRSAVATDLGMPVSRVTSLLARDKKAKYQMNDLWNKQQNARRLKQNAQRWLKEQDQAPVSRALARVPRILFSIRVGFHGTVALGTHAPMVAYQPRFWNTYVRNFVRMYRMVASPTYYEMQIQDMLRRPNYVTARRAGLQNDPFQYEDFNSPDVTEYMKAVTHMGNRGYAVLKILRQDMFDQMWNGLPKTTQIPEVAQAISDGLNHATGVTKKAAPGGVAVALFAPRLEASRVAWLAVDPARALITFSNWKNASIGEKYFAIQQVKEKAWVAGTMFSMLALNQGFLIATDSDQRVNFDDPFRGDWLKFKVGGMTASYGNPMITMARLPVRLYHIVDRPGGKTKYLIYPDEDTYTVLGEYARSQASPFASLVTDLWMRSDWQRRPLPSSDRPVPKRLRAEGIPPYTWTEFWTQQALPIPFQEAAREVWKTGMGMNDEQVSSMFKAMATIAVMGGTGARLTEDIEHQPVKDVRRGPKLPSAFADNKPKFQYMTGMPGE